MRGSFLKKLSIEDTTELMNEKNKDIFMERLLFPDSSVCVHVLIPTQFGIFLNNDRFKDIVVLWNHVERKHWNVLAKQDAFLCHCAQCNVYLPVNNAIPYQLVLRVIGARDNDNDNYESAYDVVYAFFCRRCQTTQAISLLVIDEGSYLLLCKAISKFAFTETLCLDSENLDIVQKYAERFDRLNEMVPDFLSCVMNNVHSCYHCKRTKRSMKMCPHCKSFSFCTTKSPDSRAHGKTCMQLAEWYHCGTGLCNALREHNLFHVNDDGVLYVDSAGDVVAE